MESSRSISPSVLDPVTMVDSALQYGEVSHVCVSKDLVCNIMGGLRPSMPDSAPEKYKKLAERCCDADPDKRPDARGLSHGIGRLLEAWTILGILSIIIT